MTFYEFAIDKVKKYIRNVSKVEIDTGKNYNAFELSSILEIIFDKPKEIIIGDIINNKNEV